MKISIGSCLSSLAIATLFPAVVHAQEAAESAESGLEEIVVTAEKRESSAQKTAIAIDVVSTDKLAQNGVNDIQALQNVAPGIQFGQAGTATFITVRGVSGRDSTELGDAAVAVNIDGIFLQRPTGMNAAFFDLDRIEVLRGPQGTLYGRNATGGVINIISKKPQLGEFGGYAALTLGNYKTINGEGAINLPISDSLAMRASFISRNHDGYRDNSSSLFPSNGKIRGDDEKTSGARVQLLFEPNDRFSALISGTYITQGGVGPAYAGYTPPAIQATSASGAKNFAVSHKGDFDTTRKNLSVQLNYDFGPVTATYLFGYVGLDIDHIFDNDGTDYRYWMFKRGEYSKDLSHEFRLSSNGDGPFTWQIGTYIYDQDLKVRSLNYSDNPAYGPIVYRDFQYDVFLRTRAAFGQVSYELTDGLKASAGVRYSHDKKWRDGFRLFNGGLGGRDLTVTVQPPLSLDAVVAANNTTTDEDWSYHFGLDYQITPSNLLYAKVDRGYKAGGFTTVNAYGPEHVVSYEIGSKNRFLNNAMQLNLSAFRYDYTDQQVSTFVASLGGARTLNAGKSRIWGVEAQLDWQATANDRLDLSVNWLDAKFTDFLDSSNVQRAGNRMIQSPEWTITAGYEHAFDTGNGGTVTPRIQTAYRSGQYFTFFNTADAYQGGFATLDLSLTYTAPDKAWSIQAYARNVTDKAYITSATPSSTTFQGVNLYQYGAPATFGLRAQANF